VTQHRRFGFNTAFCLPQESTQRVGRHGALVGTFQVVRHSIRPSLPFRVARAKRRREFKFPIAQGIQSKTVEKWIFAGKRVGNPNA
jgi:hypothetical protein